MDLLPRKYARILGPLLFLGSYVVAALVVRWTFSLLFKGGGIPLWPALGISIAMVLLTPRKLRPWVVLGSAAGEVFGLDTSVFDEPLRETLAALVKDIGVRAAVPFLIDPLLGPRGFKNTRRSLLFLVLSAATGIVGGVVQLVLDPPDTERWSFFLDFSVGDGLSVATFAPLALVGRAAWLRDVEHAARNEELIATLSLLTAVTGLAFFTELPVIYLVLTLVVWLAIRFGPRVALPVTAVLVVIVGIGTVRGAAGSDFGLTQFEDLRSAQFFTVAIVASVISTSSYAQRADEERRRTQATIAALPDLVAVTDDVGHVLESWPANDPNGLSASNLVPVTGPEPFVHEWVTDNGSRFYEIRRAPIDSRRELQIARDVTDLRRSQQRLEQSEQRWRDLAATAFEGLVIVDLEERVTYASRAFAEAFGTEREEIVGEPIRSMFPVADWERWEPRLRHAVESDERIETWFTSATGARRWVLVSSRPWFGSDGERVGAAFFVVETTANHEAESARRDLESRLAMVEDAERRELTQHIHDGPLQELVAVDIGLQLARERGDLPETLRSTPDVLEGVIEQLRSTLRSFAPPTVATGAVVEELVALGNRIAAGTDLVVSGRRAPGPEPIGSTAVALYRIGREAVINSIRHANPARVDLLLTTKEGGFLLKVTDDGDGIEDQYVSGRHGHFGVTGMIERAERGGGWCRVGPGRADESGDRVGTMVSIWLPTEKPTLG